MPRKTIARTRSELARIVSELDGKRQGISREEARTALRFAYYIEVVAKKVGAKSVLMPIIRRAKKKAEAMKAKEKRGQQKKV